MKFALVAFAALAFNTAAYSATLTLRPDSTHGKDAMLFNRKDAAALNYGKSAHFSAGTWTWDGDGLGQGTYRGLIGFGLTAVPATAKIKSATLYLYCDTLNFTKGQSSHSVSNAAWLMRVKEAWAESTVTWANQPAADTAGRIALAQSKKVTENYEVDVTAMVAAMVADSAKNHGFLFRSASESPYNHLVFASSDNKDSALLPKLVVEYDTTKPWTGPSVTLRPGAEGKDALLFSRKDATGKNHGHAIQFQAGTWTWDNDGLGQGSHRSLIEFDFKGIPAEAKIHSAKLQLACDTVNYTKGHSSLTSSNAAWLMRVKEAWAETTVTWANQPAADTAGRITLAESKKAKQNYEVDVTAMVADMVADKSKNHGFLLRSIAEVTYNYMTFGSSDHKDSSLHPALVVEYENPTTGAEKRVVARGNAQGLRFRVAGGELILSRPEAVEILALNGSRVARSSGSDVVNLAGIRSGTYILKGASKAAMFIIP